MNLTTWIKKLSQILLLCWLSLLIYGCAGATLEPQSFAQSKKQLQQAYKHYDFHTEFYCGIDFNPATLKLIESDTYTPRKALTNKGKENARAKRIEFEHVMPAHRFGAELTCWKNGGRKACQNDKAFKQMESDKKNLVPAIGEINGDRSNFAYAESSAVPQGQYGKCQAYTDFKNKRFYPRTEVKGIIARIYLYMARTYHITLTPQEQEIMSQWNALYPPTEYEAKLRETQDFKAH